MKEKLIYVWKILKDGKQQYKISCGSYNIINMVFKNNNKVRIYHLDVYYPKKHITFGFFNGKPSWEAIKEKVMKILKFHPQL